MSDSLERQLLGLEARLSEVWSEHNETDGTKLTNVEFGQMVGPYRVRSFLGAGSFGVVYLADDIKSNRPVALKLPRLEVLLNKEKRKRFKIEVDIVSRLDHEGIVSLLASDVDEKSAMPYIACQWCTGPDLASYLADTQPSCEESVRLMANVCDAIHFAHQQGVTHRDIKPANIILHMEVDESDGLESLDRFVAKVADFGLARLADPVATTTKTGFVLGTPAYMAPERIISGLSGGSDDGVHAESVASDIYSLGAVLYEMLTGNLPSKSNSWLDVVRQERSSSLRVPLEWKSDTPPSLQKISETCLRKQPAFRYQNAADVADDLRRHLNGQPVVGRSVTFTSRFKLFFTQQDWMKIAGWFAIVSQCIFAFWMIMGDLFKIPFGLLSIQEYLGILPNLLVLAAIGSLSVILVGVGCLKKYSIAPFIGAGLVMYNLYVPVRALGGDPTVFSEIYTNNDPYLSFMVHSIIVLAFGSQLILFVTAIVAQSTRLTRRDKRNSLPRR